jgi:hypothetical protein
MAEDDRRQVRFYWESTDCFGSAALYEALLGLSRLAQFEDHDGFSGVILGFENSDWQLEIVTVSASQRQPTDEDAERGIVLYLGAEEFRKAGRQVAISGAQIVINKNSYWTRRGAITIRGYDGESIVIVEGLWNRERVD